LGALVTLWSFADQHADADGVLLGYTSDDLDSMVGVPGFCMALPSDWIDISGEWVKLPEYQEHNGTTAKTRAQATKRKRTERNVTNVPNVSRNDRDISVTREEKRREEKKEQKTAPKVADLLPGISERIVADFLAIRKAKKQPLTETAVTGIKREAAKAGMTLEQALTESCERGWASFKAAWLTNGTPAPTAATKPRRKLLGEGSSTNYGDPA
jgi:hypothetical protein